MIKAFKPIVYPSSRILFLGTMPSEKSLKYDEYYANPTNAFWRLLAQVFDQEQFKSYQEKINFIENHNLALWDVIATCERTGSLDSTIKNPKANDFEVFFEKFPNIQHIIFTSKNACNLYQKHVGNFYNINYNILPSPSGAYAVMRFDEKLQHWKLIREVHEKLTKK